MSASTDPWEATMDRELERLMKMTDEELAASEGKTVAELNEEGARIKADLFARLRARGIKI